MPREQRKQPPAVPVELIEPIDGIPDYCNQTLVALAASLYGDISAAAEVTGHGYAAIYKWRKKNAAFDQRIADILDIKLRVVLEQVTVTWIDGCLHGFKETTTEEQEGMAPRIKTRVYQAPKSQERLIDLLGDRLGTARKEDQTFTFNPGGQRGEIGPGEILGEATEE